MINEKMPLNLWEVREVLKQIDETPKTKELEGFIKRFLKLKSEKAKGLKKELEALELMKLKPEHIAKIVDLIPEDAADLNKIFTDVSLDADETDKILKIVNK